MGFPAFPSFFLEEATVTMFDGVQPEAINFLALRFVASG